MGAPPPDRQEETPSRRQLTLRTPQRGGRLQPFPVPPTRRIGFSSDPVSSTHLPAHETVLDLVCRLLLEKKKLPLTITSYYSLCT